MLERRRSEIFYGFLGKLFLIGTCTLGAIASLWADRTVAWEAVGPYARVALPFAAMAAFVAVVAVQYAMLAVAGGITRSWSTMAVLLRIRLIYFVLATVIVLPPVLMWQMNGGTGGEVWLRVACLAAAVAVVMYVRESVTLFNSKKFQFCIGFCTFASSKSCRLHSCGRLSYAWDSNFGLANGKENTYIATAPRGDREVAFLRSGDKIRCGDRL